MLGLVLVHGEVRGLVIVGVQGRGGTAQLCEAVCNVEG